MKIPRYLTSLLSLAIMTAFLAPNVALFAQTKRGAVAANKTPAATKCTGAWTGLVTYTRTQSMSDNKKVERVSGRGYDTRKWRMTYDYSARVSVVDGVEGNGSSDAKATVRHFFSSDETVDAVELNSCDRGKTWKEMKGTSKSLTKTSGSEKTEANFSVGMNDDGTYTVSVGIPQIKGKTEGSQSTEFSGQCTKKEGKSFTMPPTETSIDGNSLTSTGAHKVDPKNPNKIAGSFTNTWQNVTETITWNLQRCGGDLRIVDIKFEDMKFPDWNAWREISEQESTVDGNLVKITATVLNTSPEEKYADVRFKETYKGDKWDGARPDSPLKDDVVSVKVPAREETEVELMWDSSGYSWYDDGRPRLVQRIKAELEEKGKKVDELTENLRVAPKPLVLVHGLWSNWQAWETWQNILTTSHSYDWKAYPVGEKAEHGRMNTGGSFMSTDPTNTIGQNADELKKYIDYAQKDRNAWHVDLVAHSMGGLISRDYINRLMPPTSQDGRPQVSHLIMLGTPNQGSPCADYMNGAFDLLGKKVEAVRQLRQDVATEFNKYTTNRKGVKFSALAGEVLPTICYANEWNDGVVTVPSAIYNVADNAKSKNVHTDLTGTVDFSGFVKPRLAIGPKGNHNPEAPTMATGMADVKSNSKRFYGASEATDPFALLTPPPTVSWAKEATIAAKQSIEIDVPVTAGPNFGAVFMAPSDISITVIDNTGRVVGTNAAGSPESRAWFRSIFVNNPVTSATWKIRLENTSERELSVIAATGR
jgi:triacylglycerol esterase/lipase EstA (alpha/beta hydrolase family)